MPFRYFILAGPGHHDSLIANVLKQQDMQFLHARYFPEFSITAFSKAEEKIVERSVVYDAYSKVIWGLSTRIPSIRRRQFHISSTFLLYDWLASGKLEESDILIAWPQVSLQSMKRFKASGKKVWLEYPMIHVREWQEIMQAEYDRWQVPAQLRRSIYPKSMAERMEDEINLADHINVLSGFAANSFKKHLVPAQKLLLTLPGIDHQFYTPPERKREGKMVVIFAGRLEVLKGIPHLIEAFKSIDGSVAELWLAGPMTDEIRPFVHNLPSNVKVLGSKDREELRELYRQADVLVLPSVQESFGLVMLEAMACGLAVIATAQTGAPDVVTHGVDGFILPKADQYMLKDAIVQCLDSRIRTLEMGMKARQKVEGYFTLRHFKDRFLTSLKQAGHEAI